MRSLIRGLPPGLLADLRVARVSLRRVASSVLSNLAPHTGLVAGSALRVNLGCGPLVVEGWVNIDVKSRPRVVGRDLRDELPFGTGSVARIHCEHVLEHLEVHEAKALLAECHRILEPGGYMRLIVPDLERYLHAYVEADASFFKALERIGGAETPFATRAEVINQMFRMGGDHRFAYDFETLSYYVRAAGFSRIDRSRQFDPEDTNGIDATDDWRALESLYTRAWK